MPRPPSPHPTDVELEILQVLWSQGPSSLSGVCEALRTEREVAATTVATMLRVMSDKGLVKRTGSGRGAEWHAVATQQRTEAGMVGALVDRLFAGAADRLAAHLVEGGQLNQTQLAELRQLIDQQDGKSKKTNATTKARKPKEK